MLKRFMPLIVVVAVLMFSPSTRAQNAQQPRQSGKDIHRDGWDKIVPGPVKDQKSAPAPVRDLTGIWEPTPGYRDGVQATGAKENPSDGKHNLPFTPEGEAAWKSHKPGFGTNAVPIAENNDPFDMCDPLGMPRLELFNLRAIQIFQTKAQVAIIYQNNQVWRNIWMDGRQLPTADEISEPRWYGYSVGKWVDDYTFVVDTVGLDERTWIDNVGRPHSDQLKVEETWHRVNHDLLEVTMTITDPKMYTKPWVALNKFQMRLMPDWFDIREMICSASEAADYNKTVAEEAAGAKK
jgi:hypothetical protein